MKPNKPTLLQRYAGTWGFVTRIIVMTLAVILVDWLLPGVKVTNVTNALLTALVISLLNNFVRPLLIVITLPFTAITLGLFLLVINAVIIILSSKLVPGFDVGGFGNAILFSLLLTVFNYLLEAPNRIMLLKDFTPPHRQPNSDADNDDFTPYEELDDEDTHQSR